MQHRDYPSFPATSNFISYIHSLQRLEVLTAS